MLQLNRFKSLSIINYEVISQLPPQDPERVHQTVQLAVLRARHRPLHAPALLRTRPQDLREQVLPDPQHHQRRREREAPPQGAGPGQGQLAQGNEGEARLLQGIHVACAIMLGIYVYLNNFNINLDYLIWTGALLALLWTLVIFRIQYLEIMTKKIEAKLMKKNVSSESDTKEIMNLLGVPLCNALKDKFQRELKMQKQTEELKECDLKKCHDEKENNKALYQLYKAMIAEMQQMGWCDVCSQGLNIEANDLKIAEIEGRLKAYRAAAGSVGLEKKKELTNRLLEEWERLQCKLPKICKRGCCIRFRVALQEIKKRHHSELSSLKGRLSLK